MKIITVGEEQGSEAVEFAENRVTDKVVECIKSMKAVNNAGVRADMEDAMMGKGANEQVVVNRSSTPLDMHTPELYMGVFYDLFFYGDIAPFRARPHVKIPSLEYYNYMCQREELVYGSETDAKEPWTICRTEYTNEEEWLRINDFKQEPRPSRWRLDPEFLDTLQDLRSRMDCTNSVRVHLGAKGFGRRNKLISSLQPDQIAKTMLHVGKKKGIDAALKTKNTPEPLREAISSLLLSTKNVPGTDGSRAHQRKINEAYRNTHGSSGAWLTMNMADDYHPLVNLIYEGPDGKIDLTKSCPAVGSLLENKRRRAQDPVGHAMFYRELMTVFLEVVLGCDAPTDLHPDGFIWRTSSSAGGVMGDVAAYHGPEEEQGRGSRHAHFSVWFVQGQYDKIKKKMEQAGDDITEMERVIQEWIEAVKKRVASVQFDSTLETIVSLGLDKPEPPSNPEEWCGSVRQQRPVRGDELREGKILSGCADIAEAYEESIKKSQKEEENHPEHADNSTLP